MRQVFEKIRDGLVDYINKNELTVSMLEFRSEIWTTTTHYIKDTLELEVTLKKYGL